MLQVIDGFAFATESLAGSFWEARDPGGLRRWLRLAGSASLGTGIGFGILFAAGKILRWGSLWATGIGFVPLAALGWWLQSRQVLWLAMTGFMTGRVLGLIVWMPQTFRELREKIERESQDGILWGHEEGQRLS